MRSNTDVIRPFKLKWTEQLDSQAIAAACYDAQMTWLQSMLNPVVTIRIFFLKGILARCERRSQAVLQRGDRTLQQQVQRLQFQSHPGFAIRGRRDCAPPMRANCA